MSRSILWNVAVLEPSVIFEAKDGKYGEDGSEVLITDYWLLIIDYWLLITDLHEGAKHLCEKF